MCMVLLQLFALHSAHGCSINFCFASRSLDTLINLLSHILHILMFLSLFISVLCRISYYYNLFMGMKTKTYGIVMTCITLLNTTFLFKENVSLQVALGPVPSCCNIEERTNLSVPTSSSCPASPSNQRIPATPLSLFVEQHIISTFPQDHCCVLYTGHWWWRQW